LDPCAGTGSAAGFLANAWNLTSWGLEFHETRAQRARLHLDHVLRTDSFETRLSSHAFSVLFLNPPYDHEADIGRTELTWLKTWTPKLQTGGILLFLIQEKDLPEMIPYLATHYRAIQVFRFPHPEYTRFHQIVIMGIRKSQASLSQRMEQQLLDSLESLPTLSETINAPWPITPSLTTTPPLFQSSWIDPQETYHESQRYGVWTDARFTSLLSPPPQEAHRPLLPLRRGHLIQLLAAGMLNNQVIETTTKRLVIKGQAIKATRTLPITTTDTQTIHRAVETFVPNIQAWDLTYGHTFGQHFIIQCQVDAQASTSHEPHDATTAFDDHAQPIVDPIIKTTEVGK